MASESILFDGVEIERTNEREGGVAAPEKPGTIVTVGVASEHHRPRNVRAGDGVGSSVKRDRDFHGVCVCVGLGCSDGSQGSTTSLKLQKKDKLEIYCSK